VGPLPKHHETTFPCVESDDAHRPIVFALLERARQPSAFLSAASHPSSLSNRAATSPIRRGERAKKEAWAS
jgi:hypothetical protein